MAENKNKEGTVLQTHVGDRSAEGAKRAEEAAQPADDNAALVEASAASSREPLRYEPEFHTKVQEAVTSARKALAGDKASHAEYWAKQRDGLKEDDTEAAAVLETAELHYYNRQGAL